MQGFLHESLCWRILEARGLAGCRAWLAFHMPRGVKSGGQSHKIAPSCIECPDPHAVSPMYFKVHVEVRWWNSCFRLRNPGTTCGGSFCEEAAAGVVPWLVKALAGHCPERWKPTNWNGRGSFHQLPGVHEPTIDEMHSKKHQYVCVDDKDWTTAKKAGTPVHHNCGDDVFYCVLFLLQGSSRWAPHHGFSCRLGASPSFQFLLRGRVFFEERVSRGHRGVLSGVRGTATGREKSCSGLGAKREPVFKPMECFKLMPILWGTVTWVKSSCILLCICCYFMEMRATPRIGLLAQCVVCHGAVSIHTHCIPPQEDQKGIVRGYPWCHSSNLSKDIKYNI